jgi:hydroxymethylpyrimidine pyrophosphatase-like HAD family hydrolase
MHPLNSGTGASARPRPLLEIPAQICRDLAWLFTDIDDTLTSDGMLPDTSYRALWDLSRAGVSVVPVTGRPAGWCDHIARMWPVAAVVGENGAFSYSYDRGRRRMNRCSAAEPGSEASNRGRLERVAARVLREIPGTALAADQPFRVSDFAIDYCEDVPPLPPGKVDDICTLLAEEGVIFKVSSIHVNFWLGAFDKLSGVRLYLSRQAGTVLDDVDQRSLFIGDSPNDEPLFAGFSHTVSVGNIRRFLPRLRHKPEFITEGDSAAGFCEAAEAILQGRSAAFHQGRS